MLDQAKTRLKKFNQNNPHLPAYCWGVGVGVVATLLYGAQIAYQQDRDGFKTVRPHHNEETGENRFEDTRGNLYDPVFPIGS